MAATELEQYLRVLPLVQHSPRGEIWSSYDAEADVLYINFRQPAQATDSELTDDDVIVRYDENQTIGVTVLHASRRKAAGS